MLKKINVFKQSLPQIYKKQSANKTTKNSLLIYIPQPSVGTTKGEIIKAATTKIV